MAVSASVSAAAGLWLSSVVLVACGNQHGGHAVAGQPCGTYDVCAVLPAPVVAAATGAKFDAGVSGDGNGTTGAASATCDYDTGKTTDPFVSVLVRCCPCGADPTATAQSYEGDGTTVMTVSGIGDSAFWIQTNADAGVPLVDQLIVTVGAEREITVTVSMSLGQVFTFDPLAAAKEMARAALSRL